MRINLKAFLIAFLLFACAAAHAQFTPGQVLTAAQLNGEFALKTNNASAAITGGTISGLSAPIPLGSGGTGATTQAAALSNMLGSSLIPIANGGTNANTATGATSQLQYLQGATGSVSRSLTSKFQDFVSVLDFGGCDITGISDSTSCLKAAAATGLPLYIPPGIYKTNATIPFKNSVVASNAFKTFIISSNSTQPTATIGPLGSDVSSYAEVANITFTHAVAPALGSGAHGLVVLAGSYQVNVHDNIANFNDNGFVVNTGSSALWLSKNNGSNNSGDGFYLVDANYILESNLSTANGRYGYNSQTVTFGGGLQMTNCLSFNNSNDGYHFVGSNAATSNDIFLSNNISSYDRGNGFFFDTHGINILLSNNFSEFNGYNFDNTIASNSSASYSFSANNAKVSMVGDEAYHATGNGLYNSGSDITVSGGIYSLNGQGSSGGYGIAGTNAGMTNVTGATVTGNITGANNTVAGFASFYNTNGVNGASFLTAPVLPASGTGVLNPFNVPVTVYLGGTTWTQIQIKVAGTISPAMNASAGASFVLAPGATIIPAYTGTPTWVWIPN